ncbi:probable protein S-acyltransferase 23 isoform X1 [Amblyraja radiata]|uniref:probable protein S-acyltransferase 23 isoform X1 n=1 Tax=Amblyraja radiata TaxID=386614 RepID=UPI0014023B14|nr:probable protein S-acyltransferase 23 isoform X1 [Amblyraja radiata]
MQADRRPSSQNSGCQRARSGGAQGLQAGYNWQHIVPALVTGNVTGLRKLAELEVVQVLSEYDEKGHTLVHWAALTGSASLLSYLVLRLPVNLPTRSEPVQRPIHWAAVKGHITAVDILLQAGVSPDERDQRGCTPLILASQFGHIALCCHLMRKGVSLQVCDSQGDNALHWAASQGHCELTRLLIYSGLSPAKQDDYGQTPLHLAVLSGSLLTVQLLCEQNGEELENEDKNGNTPLKLARGQQCEDIIVYLGNTITSLSKSRNLKFDWSALVFGPPGKSKGPILFFYGCLLLWGYPTYFTQIVSISLNRLMGFHITFLICNVLMWYLFLKASVMDPGFLLRDCEKYDHALRQAVYFDQWEQGKNPLSRLCHTCHIVRPLRSKHCRVTNRCVEYFDHYCPYIYNDVGYRNRNYFLGFLATMCLNSVMGVYLAWDWFNEMGRSIFIGIGFIFLSVITVISAIMTGIYFYMAALNLTINEHMNQKKYSYLDKNGHFHNPFNRGFRLNLMEFFHLIEPQREYELSILDGLHII